jgi:hypothetical protein
MFKTAKKNVKKDTSYENARKILIESGWVVKYHYALKVINSCKKEETIVNASKWALCVLENHHKIIEKNLDKNTKAAMFEMTNGYLKIIRERIKDE